MLRAGDFSVAVAKPPAAATPPPAGAPPAKPKKLVEVNGTGFLINPSGCILTNNHVISECAGDIRGNLTAENPVKLRVVSADEITTSPCCRHRPG